MTPRDRFNRWMFDDALPLWASTGHEGSLGTSEHLTLDAAPAAAPFKRMRVQARQVYVFAQAALLGWPGGRQRAEQGYAFILAHGQRPGGGWVRRLSPAGAPALDHTLDLYDQAFVLLALAWHSRLTGSDEPLNIAHNTLAAIDAQMAHPHGGYRNAVPNEPGPRQQNPHMHMLEALLALHETSPDPAFLTHARALVQLFRTHFFDPETSTLGEFFAEDWSNPTDHIEPGHQFEWVALLDQYATLTGDDLSPEIEALYASALRHGTDPETGLVHDAVTRNGTQISRSHRLWPQTEALKAHAVMARRGRNTTAQTDRTIQSILDRYLSNCPRGTWIDQLDHQGRPTADKIPTSSLYHLMTAYTALPPLSA